MPGTHLCRHAPRFPDSAQLVLCWCCAGHRLRGGAASPAAELCPRLHICAHRMWDSLCFRCKRLANVIKLE